jgi:hypothetical protein
LALSRAVEISNPRTKERKTHRKIEIRKEKSVRD